MLKKSLKQVFIQLFQIKNNWDNVLYLHTPFCLQKCKYCVYPSTSDFTQEEFLGFYSKKLPSQIKEYRAIFERVKFQEVYFGGGTPTILEARKMEKLFGQIPGFKTIPLKSIEASPYTLTDEHVSLFTKYKFSYLSFGVQTLSARILKKQNRFFVTEKKLGDICSLLEKTSIVYNIDLICYLDRGDEKDLPQFSEDLDYVMGTLKPASIVVHLNYKIPSSEARTIRVMHLIKEKLEKFPYFKCTNSLLGDRDAKNDTTYHAEYRLMRKSFGFHNYLWHKYPILPSFGHNILSLGVYNKLESILSNFAFLEFLPAKNKIMVLNLENIRKHDNDFSSIRKKLNLSVPRTNNMNFFSCKKDIRRFADLSMSALARRDMPEFMAALKILEN